MIASTAHELEDADGNYLVTRLDPAGPPRRVLLFAVGGGGDPGRHAPLLEALARAGNRVVAAHHPRLIGGRVTPELLLGRIARIEAALALAEAPELPVAGVGHSIGSACLLAMSGARLWMSPAGPLPTTVQPRIDRLALLCPPTGFFSPPAALDELHARITVWTGTSDRITPPSNAARLREGLPKTTSFTEQLAEGAGHFSFMHRPPPGVPEPLADRDAFLATLCESIVAFVGAVA